MWSHTKLKKKKKKNFILLNDYLVNQISIVLNIVSKIFYKNVSQVSRILQPTCPSLAQVTIFSWLRAFRCRNLLWKTLDLWPVLTVCRAAFLAQSHTTMFISSEPDTRRCPVKLKYEKMFSSTYLNKALNWQIFH